MGAGLSEGVDHTEVVVVVVATEEEALEVVADILAVAKAVILTVSSSERKTSGVFHLLRRTFTMSTQRSLRVLTPK